MFIRRPTTSSSVCLSTVRCIENVITLKLINFVGFTDIRKTIFDIV